jgi:hypothetical protein
VIRTGSCREPQRGDPLGTRCSTVAPSTTRSDSRPCVLRHHSTLPIWSIGSIGLIRPIAWDPSWYGRRNCSNSKRSIAWAPRPYVHQLLPCSRSHSDYRDGPGARNGLTRRRGQNDSLGSHHSGGRWSGGWAAPTEPDDLVVATARAFGRL